MFLCLLVQSDGPRNQTASQCTIWKKDDCFWLTPSQSLYTNIGPLRISSSVQNGTLSVWRDSGWDSSKYRVGVNLGITLPGTQPGARAVNKTEAIRWFVYAKQLGVDVIRVYDLWPDWFYQVIYFSFSAPFLLHLSSLCLHCLFFLTLLRLTCTLLF